MEAHKVDVILSAQDRASAIIGKVSSKLGILHNQGLAMGVAFAGVTIAMNMAMSAISNIGNYLHEAAEKWRAFETAIAEVNTMLTDETEHLLPSMRHAIEDMAVKFGKSAIDLARGMYQVLSASVDAEKGIRFLETAAKAATAGLTSVENAVDALTTVINAYGLQAEDAEHISDVMFQTVKRGKIRFEDLSHALAYVVPVAANAGIAFEEIAAALATMTKQGIKADMAARQLRQIINSIISPSEEASKSASEYGVMLDSLHLSVVGLEGFITELNDALGENKLGFAEVFNNVRALTGALALSAQDVSLFTGDVAAMWEESAGASSKAAVKIMESGGFQKAAIQEARDVYQREMGAVHAQQEDTVEVIKGTMAELGAATVDLGKTIFNFLTGQTRAAGQSLDTLGSHLENIDKLMAVPTTTENKIQQLREDFLDAVEAAKQNTSAVQENANAVVMFSEALKVLDDAQHYSNEEITIAIDNYNTFKDAAYDAQAALLNQTNAIAEWEAKEQMLSYALDDLNYKIPRLRDQIDDLENIGRIESDIYNASLSLRQLGIEVSYNDPRFRTLTETLNNYQMTLDSMTKSQQRFSFTSKTLNVEMMRIQLSAMGRRGRMTREEKQRMKEIERAQLENRINQMQGDIELQQFKDNYYDVAKKDYEDYVAVQQHRMHILANARNKELGDLEHNLSMMLIAQETYNSDLNVVWDEQESLYRQHLSDMLAIKKQYERQGISVPSTVTEGITDTQQQLRNIPSQINRIIGRVSTPIQNLIERIRGYQVGTPFVPQTGLYMLHRGERVTSAQQNIPQSTTTNNITINVEGGISSDYDVQRIGTIISQLINRGDVSGITSTYQGR